MRFSMLLAIIMPSLALALPTAGELGFNKAERAKVRKVYLKIMSMNIV
jgi:hypothetical protein